MLRSRVLAVRLGAVILWLSWICPVSAQPNSVMDEARRKLVDEVLVGGGIDNERVLEAMRSTPRHEFVARDHRKNAYFDMSLPIGAKQTISSPFIVAYMTQSLDPQPDDRVLEIGTGSGYQAAVLSPLVKDVYTIEIVESLGMNAQSTLKRLKYSNVHVKVGDGYLGWPEHQPFEKIIVTCSPEKVPEPLIEQLTEGGLMVIPVGERYQQVLYVMRKKGGKLEAEALRPTLFVPMTGKAEDARQVKPDPLNPKIVNGDFEAEFPKMSFVPGWYYERQVTVETKPMAPRGPHVVTFRNDVPGRGAHLLQGMPIDGRKIREIELSASVHSTSVQIGLTREETPSFAISFYDDARKEVGVWWSDKIEGTHDWRQMTKRVTVPQTAREAIVRLGLFGGTGELSFDDVRIRSVPR